MQRQEIIDLANQLTERKGEKVLSLPTLYKFVLQDICKRERFWWRRVMAPFSIVANTKTYDLSNIATFSTLSEIAVDEITKITVILAATPLSKTELVPVFDPETLVEMTINTTQVSPGRYTMNASSKVLLLDPPDANYSAYLVGWGMPDPATDTPSDTVPLVPTWGHNTIVMGMVAKIFRFAYGSKNDKTIDAMAEYEQGIQDLEVKKQFDPNYSLQLISSESAVRST